MSADTQPPIADYALLSDSQGAALVSRRGSIDWACLPRFDSPATFARILDRDAGHWLLSPVDEPETTRAYIDATMVLRTEHRTGSGAVAVTDALVFMPLERGHGIGHDAPHVIVRLVEGLAGEVEMRTEVAPRPEYGLTTPRWQAVAGGAFCRGGPSAYVLSCPSPVEVTDGTATARFTVRRGERVGLTLLACQPWQPLPKP